ncbi:apoptosis-inducing factor 2, partial [Phenoliferia sp. Uapishka_3]
MTTTPLLNVVIVGFGLSGAGAANALSSTLPPTHRLICISATEAAFYSISSIRGAVTEPWGTKTTVDLSEEKFFGMGSRHRIVVGNVVEFGRNHVVLDNDFEELGEGGGRRIEFEYAVLAMGSSYPKPCRPPPDQTSTTAVTAYLETLQEAVKNSTSILITGGGPVGIEFAGEVAALYGKSKLITLVHSAPRFFEGAGFKPSLGESLKSQLIAYGVNLVFGTRLDTGDAETGKLKEKVTYDLGDGGVIEPDFLFKAYGSSPNTSLLNSFQPPILDPTSHRVLVSPTFQVQTLPSSTSQSSPEQLDHIFAIGDITNVDETKLWAHSQFHGAVVGANIVKLIKDPQVTSLKQYTPGAKIIVVCVGPNGGAGQINMGIVVGAWATALAKSRGLFYSKFQSLYHA